MITLGIAYFSYCPHKNDPSGLLHVISTGKMDLRIFGVYALMNCMLTCELKSRLTFGENAQL